MAEVKTDCVHGPGSSAKILRMSCQIIAYEPQHQSHFEQLNRRWLEAYFRVEPIDQQVLGHPQHYIIDPGGQILMAQVGEHIVGTCALKYHHRDEFELTKMAVDPGFQGQGIGVQLLTAAIGRFQQSPAQLLWLETNHILTTAIGLYQKFGFRRIGSGPRPGSDYQRADYYMQWQPEPPRNPVC